MKTKLTLIQRAALLLLLLSTLNPQLSTWAQGTTFTYQGSLNDNGSPANGTNYGMVFYLYDAPTNGNVLGNLGIGSVSVSNGLFTVPLDFGTNFPGPDRWLEITVQKNSGSFSALTPRQKLSPTPYAITAANLSGSLPAGQLTGTIPATSIAGPYTSAITLNNPANSFTGSFIGDGSGLINIPTSGSAWQLTGNAGTTPGANFLGTTDNQPLELKINGTRALRLEPGTNGAPNLIGGYSNNFVVPGTVGAVIAGGGAANFSGNIFSNSVAAAFSSIGGGDGNVIQAKAFRSVISGGSLNTIQAAAGLSTIGGGGNNTIQGSLLLGGNYDTIGGGAQNTIQTNANEATIGGGEANTIQTNSSFSTIGGGQLNAIWSLAGNSTISGGGVNVIQTSSGGSAIGGGNNNLVRTNSSDAVIGGGQFNSVQSSASYATVGGGQFNMIQTNASWAIISGGMHNTNIGNYATVPGGDQNVAGASSFAAGHRAKATNTGTFVWADSTDVDFASTADNQFLIRASGGVGIGTANPDAALSVNGTADKPGGGAWTVFSDARLKKNIEPLTGALNRLLELRAVTFEYKDPQSIHELSGIQIGMIAQEVEKVFPDWVDTAPNGMKRLSIHGFEALTVEALRELRAEKDSELAALRSEKEREIQNLKSEKDAENLELKQRLEKLEQLVHNLKPD